jgi:hypothetical protein
MSAPAHELAAASTLRKRPPRASRMQIAPVSRKGLWRDTTSAGLAFTSECARRGEFQGKPIGGAGTVLLTHLPRRRATRSRPDLVRLTMSPDRVALAPPLPAWQGPP